MSFANTVSERPRDLAKEFPDAFSLQHQARQPQPKGILWPELEFKDDTLNFDEKGVTCWEDRERLYFRKGKKTWTRLRFPSTVSFNP
jgi:hypothetical protein